MITEKELSTLYEFCDKCELNTVCREEEMLKTAYDQKCKKFEKKEEFIKKNYWG